MYNKMRNYYQEGGQAQGGGDELQQAVEAIMQIFQQLPPEVQGQVLEMLAQVMEQGQAEQGGGSEEEQMMAEQQAMQQQAPMQMGGNSGQGKLMQIIAAYAEMNGTNPKMIMQQLQKMSPEERQQALQQMAQAVQGAMQGQEGGDAGMSNPYM